MDGMNKIFSILKKISVFYLLIGIWSPVMWFISTTKKYESWDFFRLPFFVQVIFLFLLVLTFTTMYLVYKMDNYSSKYMRENGIESYLD